MIKKEIEEGTSVDLKAEVSTIIKARIKHFKMQHHLFEAKRLTEALNAIQELVPPFYFIASSMNETDLIAKKKLAAHLKKIIKLKDDANSTQDLFPVLQAITDSYNLLNSLKL